MFKRYRVILGIGLAGLWAFPLWASSTKSKETLRVYSDSFKSGENIPDEYTCKGKNISPDIFWKGVPPKTKSFALIVEDPDAPTQVWTHWVIYNIPVKKNSDPRSIYELTSGFPCEEEVFGGILQGTNDFKKIGYDGPCPPSGIHRYYFELYALNRLLDLSAGVTKAQLISAMKGHILARTQMMGTSAQ